MVYGYARVSTDEQDPEAQVAELKAMGCERVFVEKASGKDRDRPVLGELMDGLKPRDVLLVLKIDRLARSLKNLIFLLDEIAAKEAVLKMGSSSFDFSTAEGRLTANLLGSVAEFERQLISERTKLGLKNARAMGRTGGRPRGFSAEAEKLAKKAYLNRQKELSVKLTNTVNSLFSVHPYGKRTVRFSDLRMPAVHQRGEDDASADSVKVVGGHDGMVPDVPKRVLLNR